MSPDLPRRLDVDSLAQGIPVIPEDAVGFYKHNCMVCFHSQNHASGVGLESHHGELVENLEVHWAGELTEQLERSYRDDNKATDFGACVIALLLVRELTQYTAIEQSNVGTTIDYYLVNKDQQDDTLIFNHAAYLEVSGIRHESKDNTVEGRIKEKVDRLKKGEDIPALIVVVEFSRPWSKMIQL